MEIAKNFGLDPTLLAAQIINFLLLVYLLNRFFLPKILGFLKRREEKIRQGLEAAQKGEELFKKVEIREKEILQKARMQAKEILAEARIRESEQAKKIEEQTKRSAEKIIEDARELATREGEKVREQITRDISKLAILVLERSLKKIISPEEHKKIVENLTHNVRVPV